MIEIDEYDDDEVKIEDKIITVESYDLKYNHPRYTNFFKLLKQAYKEKAAVLIPSDLMGAAVDLFGDEYNRLFR